MKRIILIIAKREIYLFTPLLIVEGIRIAMKVRDELAFPWKLAVLLAIALAVFTAIQQRFKKGREQPPA